MCNRRVLRCGIGGLSFGASVFDGSEETERGKVALYVEVRGNDGQASAEVRTYCRSGFLRRLAADLLAAAETIEATEGE